MTAVVDDENFHYLFDNIYRFEVRHSNWGGNTVTPFYSRVSSP